VDVMPDFAVILKRDAVFYVCTLLNMFSQILILVYSATI